MNDKVKIETVKSWHVTFQNGKACETIEISAATRRVAIWLAQVKANKDGGNRQFVMIQPYFPNQKPDRFNEIH